MFASQSGNNKCYSILFLTARNFSWLHKQKGKTILKTKLFFKKIRRTKETKTKRARGPRSRLPSPVHRGNLLLTRDVYASLLITYYSLLLTYSLLSITYNVLLITYDVLLITYHLLLITHYWLFVTCYLLCTTYASLFITYYFLLITYY